MHAMYIITIDYSLQSFKRKEQRTHFVQMQRKWMQMMYMYVAVVG
jgi:hypothetical protein